MPASCSFCSKQQTKPLTCSACHVAVYCSKDCQRKHWASHKDQCKKIQKQTGRGPVEIKTGKNSSEESSGNSKSSSQVEQCCPSCNKVIKQGSGKVCHFCKMVEYCTKDCQQKDWKMHQKVCEKLTKDEKESSRKLSSATASESGDPGSIPCGAAASLGSSEVNGGKGHECQNCRLNLPEMKSCSRCRSVFYCSRECQKENWPEHKNKCSNIDSSIKTKGFKEREKEEAKSKRGSIPEIQHLMNMMGIRTEEEMQNIPSQPCMSIEEARILCLRHFFLCKIVEDLGQLPHEMMFGPLRDESTVLLARISKLHPYKQRHSVYIEDSFGQETFVMFYLDYDNPFPHFHWSHVVPGNYLCFQGPFFHYFLDGTVGIRIEDPMDAFIIHKGLKRK